MVVVGSRSLKPAGSSPGTVMYIGEERVDPVTVSLIRYDQDSISPAVTMQARDCKPDSAAQAGVAWFTIDGVHDPEALRVIGENFNLHPLVVEDIANTQQRPKIEDFDSYIFIAMKMITYDPEIKEICAEHVSFIIGDGYVLAFLEDEGDVFEPVRQRLRAGKGKIRKQRADYLVYALMDAVVDNYFSVLEDLGELIDDTEEEVVGAPTTDTLKTVHALKRELIYLRRSVWPLREVVSSMLRDDSEIIKDETKIFLRDLHDHTIHVIDTVETMRDIVAGMLEVYLSSVSNKMNQVMKVLTVMSSIFIPLTFVAGVYGMNFQYMPELSWPYGYPLVMALMGAGAVALLIAFKRRGWL